MKQNGKIKDFLLWTVLAIVLGLIVSFAFLPLLGVDPVDSLKIMLTETFSDKFTMGNILIKTTPLTLTALLLHSPTKPIFIILVHRGSFMWDVFVQWQLPWHCRQSFRE